MSVFYLLLRFIHVCYSVAILFASFWRRLAKPSPLPLDAPRLRLPRHLAVVFVVNSHVDIDTKEQQLMENIITLVRWCRTMGIKQLTLYDSDGNAI
jgi:dehydrodolichyl diphosphate syntase complex subunit NUS1